MKPENNERRKFLVGAGAATLATGLHAAAPQPGGASAENDRAALKVVDFHNHYVGSAFASKAGAGAPAALNAYFERVNRDLSNSQALLSSIETAGIDARVVNTPLEFLRNADDEVPVDTPRRINVTSPNSLEKTTAVCTDWRLWMPIAEKRARAN